MPRKTFPLNHAAVIGTGIALIVLACVMAGLSLWEAFGGFSRRFRMIRLPGFHELKLDKEGLYAGVYQHQGATPLPAKELSQMQVQIFSKGDYREVPVLMNTAGQTFTQFGMAGMPLFNFMIDRPGAYTMSGVYPEGRSGPTVNILVFAQEVQNVKQTLFVGASFFVLFLGLGIFVLVKARDWAPA